MAEIGVFRQRDQRILQRPLRDLPHLHLLGFVVPNDYSDEAARLAVLLPIGVWALFS